MRTSCRVVSASLSYPDFVMVGADQTVTHNIVSNSGVKLLSKKYTMKMSQQPITAQFFKTKSNKLLLVAFDN